MPEYQSSSKAALAAIALARAADVDDPICDVAWKQLDTEEQTAVMYILALWVAQFRQTIGIPWEAMVAAAERLPN